MMQDRTEEDGQLLHRYVERADQAAFGLLVERYLRLVYATCLRETGEAALAEDAAQAVFLLLANKASALKKHPSLAGWLFAAARLVCRNAKRRQRRRLQQEWKAVEGMAQQRRDEAADAALWERLEPGLNDALSALGSRDREAILLRFFRGLSLAETGAALGVSADAAQMRVSRAVERMRRHLARSGSALDSTALLTLLPGRAAPSLPVGGAARVLAAISGKPPLGNVHQHQLYQGAMKAMWMTNIKIAALAASLSLLGVWGGLTATRTLSAPKAPHAAKMRRAAVQPPRTMPAGAALARQAQDLQLTGDFTLVYRTVTRDLSGQVPVRPPQTSLVTVSSRGDALYLRQMDPQGMIGTVLVYDGTNSVTHGTGSRFMSGTPDKQPGVFLFAIGHCPMPGMGLPHVPLLRDAQPALAAGGHPPARWQVVGSVLRIDAGTPQLDYVPGRVELARRGGRLVMLSAVTTGTATPDGQMDYTKPQTRWDFTSHRLFRGHWIASGMRWTHYENGTATWTCDFALQSASDTPLSAALFAARN